MGESIFPPEGWAGSLVASRFGALPQTLPGAVCDSKNIGKVFCIPGGGVHSDVGLGQIVLQCVPNKAFGVAY